MPSDYLKIAQDNIRRRGEEFADIGRFLAEELYSDQTHFIYELLQNADDAIARRMSDVPASDMPKGVQFDLFNDRLEVRHFGQLFTEDDVMGICDVLKGTKRDDSTQIGKFGIGFKSVYAFTASPEIHSGTEHFKILGYIRPHTIAERRIASEETLFVFPFDHPSLAPADAFALIRERLRILGPRTLLFLGHIDEISWTINGVRDGNYLRADEPDGRARRVTVIGEGQDAAEQWLVFGRSLVADTASAALRVEAAFRLVADDKTGEEAIVPVDQSQLVVFFPTKLETHLGFLIQGPYRTTPARNDVREDDEWNERLVEETGTLIVDALTTLKDRGLLSATVLTALPISAATFPVGHIFRPIYDAVRSALRELPLLPIQNGGFAAAERVKLARGNDLLEMFTPQQLGSLFAKPHPIYWLSGEITEARTPELYRYLTGYRGYVRMGPPLIEDVEVRAETAIRRFTKDFLKQQTDAWLTQLYAFLDRHADLRSMLRQVPIIRLQNGKQTEAFRDGRVSVYLPSVEDTGFPTVKREIASDPFARAFLSNLGLKEPDVVAEVRDKIVPRYHRDPVVRSDAAHRRDIQKICRAVSRVGANDPDLLRMLRATKFVRAENAATDEVRYVRPAEAYTRTAGLEQYFEGNPSAYFVSGDYPENHLDSLCLLGVRRDVQVIRRHPDQNGNAIIAQDYGWHKRGLRGFDPDCTIDGLQHALDTITEAKAAYIWNQVLSPNPELIRGIVESSTVKSFERIQSSSESLSVMGELVTERAWIPGKDGVFRSPRQMAPDDLPDNFIASGTLASALGMQAGEIQTLARKIGIAAEDLTLLQNHRDAFDRWKREIRESEMERNHQANTNGVVAGEDTETFAEKLAAAFDKPRGLALLATPSEAEAVGNPARRRELTRAEIEHAIVNEPRPDGRFARIETRVWEAKDQSAQIFLREQYAGRCQICNDTFQKRNGQPYFEGLYLVSRTHARWISRPGNIVCLCSTCCAKFIHGPVDADDIIDQIRSVRLQGEGGTGKPSLRIRLCDRDVVIRFTEAHMLDLQEIIRRAEHEAMTD